VKNWVSFLNERAPPVVYILLSFFPAVSGLKLAEGLVDYEKLGWGTTGLLVSKSLVWPELLLEMYMSKVFSVCMVWLYDVY